MNLPPSLAKDALGGAFEDIGPIHELNRDPRVLFVGNKLIGDSLPNLNKLFRPRGYLVDVIKLKRVDGEENEFPVYRSTDKES